MSEEGAYMPLRAAWWENAAGSICCSGGDLIGDGRAWKCGVGLEKVTSMHDSLLWPPFSGSQLSASCPRSIASLPCEIRRLSTAGEGFDKLFFASSSDDIVWWSSYNANIGSKGSSSHCQMRPPGRRQSHSMHQHMDSPCSPSLSS